MNIFQELKWRNFIYNKTKNIKNLLYNKFIIYIGYDPTYKYLHIGHLISFFLLKLFLNFYKKNKIIILIGEYTTKINIKNNNKIIYNIKFIKKQILLFLKKIINNNIKTKIIILNNNLWFKKIYLLKFINKILLNINFKKLIYKKKKKKNIIKFKNFKNIIYPIIQSYDYLYLYKKYKCNLQIGGADQWRNIILGIKLIKKIFNKKVYGLTYPLLTNNKNIKFSKSNKNFNIWLKKKKNKPYEIYQFFINLNDKIAINFIKYISFLKIKNIKYIILKHKNRPKKKYIQKILAKLIINLIYSNKIYKYSKYLSKYLFEKNNNFLLLKNYKFFLKKNIKIINIKKKKNLLKNKIINILYKNLNLYYSKKKIKFFFKKKHIFFNKINYNNFIKKYLFIKNKYIIVTINKKFYILYI